MDKLHEVAKPNIDRLYTQLFSIKEMLSEVIQTAQEAANDAGNFGGDISKVIPNQLRTQFVVGIQNFISQQGNPVAIDSIIQYLDSLPLSKVRVPRGEEAMMNEPQMGQMGSGTPPPNPSGAMAGVVPNAGSAIPPTPGMGMGESARRMKEHFFYNQCPKCDTELTDGFCPECGYDSEDEASGGDLVEPYKEIEDDEDDEFAALESAILKAKGQDLLNETRTMWEAEHQEEEYQEGSLDFKHIKEGYQRRPSTPEVFTKNDENKIYKRVVEKAQAKPNKLQEADILASPYARQDVSDMSGWRDLVETHVNDEEIRERLGAGAVASALLAEANDEEVSKGLKRMKEIVSPQAQEKGADASDIAAMAARGAFNESLSDEISPARIKASMQENVNNGEDLTALVLGDTRELADVK